jgi:hypothetical protein
MGRPAWVDRGEEGVTSSRKGAKTGTHGRKLRATGTKARTRVARTRPPSADLEQQLKSCRRDLSEALEQQTATSEVLQVISSSPGELQPVFQTMLENATRICEAKFGTLLLFEEDELRLVAMHGAPREFEELRRRDPSAPIIVRRLVETRRIVHIADIAAEEPFARLASRQARGGTLVRQRANAQGE